MEPATSKSILKSDSVGEAMSFEYLELLRGNSKAWKLLMADHAAFIASFFYKAFLAENNRAISETDLRIMLDSWLQLLNDGLSNSLNSGLKNGSNSGLSNGSNRGKINGLSRGSISGLTRSSDDGLGDGADNGSNDDPNDGSNEMRFSRTSKEYLDEWSDDEHGWLRKYYPGGKDEPHFDLTPQAQKALEWLIDQRPSSYIAFIGTESRLITVFDILRQIVEGAETNPELRIASLEKQKAEIEAEIEKVRNGELSVYDETQVRERFAQAITIARDIQADFRAVEENFRRLDRGLREKISVWEKGKGELLEAIFEDREGIAYSEQGKSFSSFWKFLMSPELRESFRDNLRSILDMPAVKEMALPANVRDIEYDWIDSGKHIVDTVTRLSSQLRTYVDENYIEEERRILKLMRGIERKALALREAPPKDLDVSISALGPDIKLPMDRPLWTKKWRPHVAHTEIENSAEDVPTDALFSQIYVDRAILRDNIARALQLRDEATLSDILAEKPIKKGLSELLGYVELSDEQGEMTDTAPGIDPDSDPEQSDAIYPWVSEYGDLRAARTQPVVFRRKPESAGGGR